MQSTSYNWDSPKIYQPNPKEVKMSGSSHEYYHSPKTAHSDDRSLPSIRDVVGDELEGRVAPNPYTFGDVRGALLSSHHHAHQSRNDQRGPTLPPIRESYSSAVYSESHGRYPVPSHQELYSRNSESHRGRGREEPGHVYGVLRPSATASRNLIHATPPAERPHGILRQSSTPHVHDQDSDRRHRCYYCGKGFDRPSSLEVHLRTHTGSQPFACEWPGCNRTFSVRSNMLRHWRSHEKNSSSSSQRHGFTGRDPDDNYDSDPRGDFSSSRYFYSSSSSAQQPSGSHYHSSSRHQ